MEKKIGNIVIDLTPSEPHKYRLGFPITPEDEERMFLHCISAARFMQKYGQVHLPYDREEDINTDKR